MFGKRSSIKTDKGHSEIPQGYGGPIEEINENDVLSGRGGRINSHTGNVRFRMLVAQHKHAYLSKTTKKLDKVKIAAHIVHQIRNTNPRGRFLKEDPETNSWKEIGDEKAKKKAGQAMREKAPETRRELNEGKGEPFVPTANVAALQSATVSSEGTASSSTGTEKMPRRTSNASGVPPNYLNQANYSGVAEAYLANEHPGQAYYDQQNIAANLGGFLPQTNGLIQPDTFISGNNDLLNNSFAGRTLYAQYGANAGNATLPFDYRPSTTIPENTQTQSRIDILGASAAAFSRPFNKMSDRSSSGRSSLMSSMGMSVSSQAGKSPSSNDSNGWAHQSINYKNLLERHISDTSSSTMNKAPSSISSGGWSNQRTNYKNMLEQNVPNDTLQEGISEVNRPLSAEDKRKQFIALQTAQEKQGDFFAQNNDGASSANSIERRRKFIKQEQDTESSYLPRQLTEADTPLEPNRSNSDLMKPTGMTRSRSLPGASEGNLSMMDFSLSNILGGDLDPDLSKGDLDFSDNVDSLTGFRLTSGSSKSNISELPPVGDRGISETSIDDMSIDSKRSLSNSSWLRSYRNMQSVEDPRQRYQMESNRSMFSDLSQEILALDLANDNFQ